MAALTLGVLHSGLPTFVQALLIATVSASITAFAMVYAARVAARNALQIAREVKEGQEHIASKVDEVKSAVGADRRRTDRKAP